MSPRKPAVLRNADGPDLREHLIATAARLLGQRGSAGLAVRDIAGEAQVADGVLYNYFEDKEDLLAHALLAHVAAVMTSAPPMPQAGTGTVAGNLALAIDRGLAVLERVAPAFAGLVAQPKVLLRFYAFVGGDAAFGAPAAGDGDDKASPPGDHEPGPSGQDPGQEPPGQEPPGQDPGQEPPGQEPPGQEPPGQEPPGPGPDSGRRGEEPGQTDREPRGIPASLSSYLRAEQRLGRIDPAADVEAAVTLLVGAIHGQVLPRVLFNPPGAPITTPPGFSRRLADTILGGIAPGSRRA